MDDVDVFVWLQFFSDADDVDTWMLDMLRLVSSEDVGHDEASVQSLVKKHKVGLVYFGFLQFDELILYVNVDCLKLAYSGEWCFLRVTDQFFFDQSIDRHSPSVLPVILISSLY